jgi:uncharacterized protein
MKVLLWAAIGFIVVMWLLRGNERAVGRTGKPGKSPALEGESMVKCAHCGVFVPVSEAIGNGAGQLYCSEAHRLQHGG